MIVDSQEYLKKKKFLKKILTLYGRKPCLEALEDKTIKIYKLHLANTNKHAPIIKSITQLAQDRDIDIQYHDKKSLSRISKNSQQDQGVALDCIIQGFNPIEELFKQLEHFNNKTPIKLIALDKITNPQNLGMIIRSVCASPATGILLPEKGCAKIDALVIKASAGTLFKSNIYRCDELPKTLKTLKENDFQVVGLDLSAKYSLDALKETKKIVYVLGNETRGISTDTREQCNNTVKISMANNVESLNVAVTAALIAFKDNT